MIVPAQSPSAPPAKACRRFTGAGHRAGFSLVELAVVGVIIGILAALAVPYFQRIRDRSAMSAFQHDLRVFEQEFDSFELEKNVFPPSDIIPGQYPAGMENRLSSAWLERTPIGGTYRWVYTTEADISDRSAYIEVVGTDERPLVIGVGRLREIDEAVDDGNLSTGNFRRHGLNVRYYIR